MYIFYLRTMVFFRVELKNFIINLSYFNQELINDYRDIFY